MNARLSFFAAAFAEHECKGARRAGFGGKKNGQLLQLA